jgi:hypothetical protein
VLPSNATAAEPVLAELSRWEQSYVDVVTLKSRAEQAERDNEMLGEKVTLLERRVQVSRPVTEVQISVTRLNHYTRAWL